MRRLLALAVFALLSLPSFSQSVSFNINRLPQSMTVVGDFNGDGREDGIIFTEINNTSGFHTQISTATAAYTAGPSYNLPTGSRTRNYTVADFNNDGKLDLVITTYDSKLLVYLGQGNGSFQSPKTIPLPFLASSVQAADVNHDGKMDLVLVNGPNNAPATLVSYLGDGTGGFTAGPSSSFDYNYAINGVGDFDGDGKADIVTANCGPGGCTFTVYYGDGAGHFGSPAQVGTNQANLSIADVDGDGRSDIITSVMGYINSKDQPYLAVFYGSADRTLQSAQIPTSQCTFGRPIVADFNGDHIPDIIFPEHECLDSPQNAQMAFLAGQGNRVFGPEQTVYYSRYSQQPGGDTRAMRANNSDSKPDFYFSEIADASGSYPAHNNLLVNSSSGVFAGCNAPNPVKGFHICSPAAGSTVASPVKFSVGASGGVPMRKVEVWADGVKQVESLYAFSDYAFLDANVPLSAGTHNITLISAGWDNSLQSKSYSITVSGGGGGCTSGNTITVCSPTANSTVSSPVHVQASTILGSPTYRFELWDGGTKLFTVRDANTMDTTVSLSAGTHKLAFVAKLADGTRRELDVSFTVR